MAKQTCDARRLLKQVLACPECATLRICLHEDVIAATPIFTGQLCSIVLGSVGFCWVRVSDSDDNIYVDVGVFDL